MDRALFPDEFRARATSLSSHLGRSVDRVRFAQRLYGSLERVFDLCETHGFDAIRPEFEARFRLPGRRVTVLGLDGREAEGTVCGIDADGALRLRGADDVEFRVVAGDVTLAKEDA